MKKALLIPVFAFLMVMVMMPLQVFANQASNVETTIPGTSLILEGEKAATQATSEKLDDGDYFVTSAKNVYINVNKNEDESAKWILKGGDSSLDVNLISTQGDASAIIGDLTVNLMNLNSNCNYTLNIQDDCTFNITDQILLASSDGDYTTYFLGKGTVNSLATGFSTEKQGGIYIDGPNINLYTTGVETAVFNFTKDIVIKNGKVIIDGSGYENSFGIFFGKNITIGDQAEFYACGKYLVGGSIYEGQSTASIGNTYASENVISYNDRDTITDNAVYKEVEYYENNQLFTVNGDTNKLAKTLYHPAVKSIVHHVTFDYNDGGITPSKTVDVNEGETVARPENPTREGYVFQGWFVSPECTGTTFDFENTPITNDIKLYAGWTSVQPPTPGDNPTAGEITQTGDNVVSIIMLVTIATLALATVLLSNKKYQKAIK